MAMTTARQKVLSYLKKQRTASAAQIGRALSMSAANVRHHLSVLLSDGRISMVGETKKMGRGRPVKMYRLSEHLRGDNLTLLSDQVLSQWLNKLSESKREDALRALAKGLGEQFERVDPKVPVAKRLAFVVDQLNRFHYQARWEAGAEGPRILLGNCPYAAIIEKHPELCRMDNAMLRDLVGVDEERSKLIPGGREGICYFWVYL